MAPVRGSAPRRAKAMHKTASFATTKHPPFAATCCLNASGHCASIEPVAAPQVVVCRPNAVAVQPSRCRPERPHQCDRSALPVQFSPRVSCRHKAYTTISPAVLHLHAAALRRTRLRRTTLRAAVWRSKLRRRLTEPPAVVRHRAAAPRLLCEPYPAYARAPGARTV